jgi:hypothetical protein
MEAAVVYFTACTIRNELEETEENQKTLRNVTSKRPRFESGTSR